MNIGNKITNINEAKEIKNNAIKVKEGINIDIPILMFCSNGKGTGLSEEQWEKLQKDFIAHKKEGNLINLECSHYVHNHEYKKIAEDMKSFINNINY